MNHTNLEDILAEALREQERKRQEWFTTLGSMKADLKLKDEERFRVVEAYRKGLLDSEDLERQLTAIQEEKGNLEGAIAELERKLELEIAPKDAIAFVYQKLEEFREAALKERLSFQEKRRIIEAFVKEVWVCLKKGKKQGIMLRETIPFRENILAEHRGGDLSPLASRMTVWIRPGHEGNGDPEEKEGTVQIVYRFPFPPKPKELVSIAGFTVVRMSPMGGLST